MTPGGLMPDNWGYVFAAYAIVAVALAGYWRRLVRRTRALGAGPRRRSGRAT